MSAQIRLTLTDETGLPTEQVDALPGGLDNLDQIDQAVEHFKQAALPQVAQRLLEQAQQRFGEQEKKTLAPGQRDTPR